MFRNNYIKNVVLNIVIKNCTWEGKTIRDIPVIYTSPISKEEAEQQMRNL